MADILFLAPHQEIMQVAGEICAGSDDIEIEIARMDDAVQKAARAEHDGYHILISRGLTSWRIVNSGVPMPLVDVSISGYDIIKAYYEAKKIGRTVGFIDTEEVAGNADLETFAASVRDRVVKYYCSNDLDDIDRGVRCLIKAGVDVVIGKVAMANEARRQGLAAVVITSGYEAVRSAVNEARRMNMVRKLERRKAEQLKAILEFTYDGIIALDKEGKITVFNRTAERLSGWEAKNAVGRHIAEVIPKAHCHELLITGQAEIAKILDIGSYKTIANRVPIIVDGRVDGVVTTFQEMDRLKKIEGKVREQLAQRGFAAKYDFSHILGDSAPIRNAVNLAGEYAWVDSTVLLYGRTGSGKEIFAHAIHNASHRKGEPFVSVNCAALPENLLESELFGYRGGAFTGARKEGRAGMFEMAHKGTLFLDEVGEMSPMLQSKLLRVIEEGEVMRLGDSSMIPVDVRLIAATHRNLRQMAAEMEFREDLYYRLSVLTIYIPPLCERGRDVITIANHFLAGFCAKRNRSAPALSADAEKILLTYSWPGNIRELRNVMERLAMQFWQQTIDASDIIGVLHPGDESANIIAGAPRPMVPAPPAAGLMDAEQRRVIREMLAATGGNKAEAARRLGISRTTLWRKLQT
ncbi:MAG: sigma 54-interacting transcriptional regulator [Gracilibacteraceae bacterium]|jgi:PAS domain S-box-containing protein|nr:sigma 54-interacting transcriptional regulator [Gracilibacteraceae bacterium]